MHQLSLQEAEYIAHRLAVELMNYMTEPMPEFNSRYPHKLESCLNTPFQEFEGKDLYPGLYRKAAALFYLVTKNHPFENGNKRMAVALTLTFLYLNDYFLAVSPNELYDLSLHVAERDIDIYTSLDMLEQIFKENTQKKTFVTFGKK